jgi:hypothetical protein
MHAIADASIPTLLLPLLPLLPIQCDTCNPQARASLIAAAQAMSWKTSQPEANTTQHKAQYRARVAPASQHSTANALSGRRELGKRNRHVDLSAQDESREPLTLHVK